MKILIIKPSSLGDVVQALPVLKCLRKRYPDATIDWLVNEELGEVLLDNAYLKAIHLWDRASWRRPGRFFTAVKKAVTLVQRLRRTRYDLVFDLQGLFRSGLIAFLSGAKEVIGFAEAREMAPIFYDRKVAARAREMHSVERYMLAVGADASDEKEFPVGISPRVSKTTKTLLSQMAYDGKRPFVVLAPGGRWRTKRWPVESFASLVERLTNEERVQVGLVGSSGERRTTERIAFLSGSRTMDFSGKTTLRELVCLMKKADVVAGNDSGPIHIAAAVGTPVVGLYGPTSPARTGPYGSQHTVLTSTLPCSPCFSRKCSLSVACMKQISVDAAYQACKRYLAVRRKTIAPS